MTLFAFSASLSCISLPMTVGTICRQTIFVLQPAALILCSAFRKLLPQLVYFLLRLAVHHQGYGFREFELRAAVQCQEFLSIELERNDHYRSLWSSGDLCPCVSITGNVADPRILENRDIKLRSLFGYVVEPQEWGDFLHGSGLSNRPSAAWLSAFLPCSRRARACRPTSDGRTGPRSCRSDRPRTC